MSESKPIGGKVVTGAFLVALCVAAIAGFLLIKRFMYGLGAVTNLNDAYPWGLWITYDVLVGTALGCGGFAMALVVYVANKGQYHSLIRPALLGSLFGYTLAGASIFFDIGRYWQFYNIILPQFINLNSVMAEVALCVMAYTGVLWIEFSPAFIEGRGGSPKGLNKMMFVFIAVGVLLPTMHQSSLGTLMVISGNKLSPLWQTNLIPLLFLISAISMGYAVVVFESLVSSVAFKRPLETKILSRISGIMAWLLLVYLVIRFLDVLFRGAFGLVFAGDAKTVMFVVENALFIVPVFLLLPKNKRANPKTLFVAASCMLLAGAVYRFDAFLVGFEPAPGWSYFPSVEEIVITLGVVAVEIMGYLIFVKKLPVLPKLKHA